MASHDRTVAPEPAAISPLLDWVEERCREAGIPGELSFKFVLAIEEAATNVVSYAFTEMPPPPHQLRVRLDIDSERCIAELIDNGRPFDPSAAPPPDLAGSLDERDPGGLGIHLLRQMADRVEYRRENGENRLRIETLRR
ncbi:MAG: ATP-binding protein [Alphaproteobacteria bacterium]|nr:ATP-binding protein [Alphaproteobacteria bacterium]MBV9152741.1 ATP-binding protein [Alphaproteobacteria bacterium]